MTTRKRAIYLMGVGAAALSLAGAPAPADADSRRQVFKPDQNVVDDVARDSAVDPVAIGLGIALAIGGLAILTGRRRSSV